MALPLHRERTRLNFYRMPTVSYNKFMLMLVVSFCVMYGVMFLNVDEASLVYLSTIRACMALLMVWPMTVFMLLLMGKMIHDKRRNTLLITTTVVLFFGRAVAIAQPGLSGRPPIHEGHDTASFFRNYDKQECHHLKPRGKKTIWTNHQIAGRGNYLNETNTGMDGQITKRFNKNYSIIKKAKLWPVTTPSKPI